MSFTELVQSDFIKEAEIKSKNQQDKKPAEQPTATTETTETTNPSFTGVTTPGPQETNGSGKLSFSQIIKERLGLELTEEEIVSRVKGQSNGASDKKPDDVPQAPDPYSEDEIIAALEKKGKTRDYYKRAKEIQKTEDLAVVKEYWKAQLKTVQPDLTDEDTEDFINQKYSISEEEGVYSDHEKQFGKLSIKDDAARIREIEAADLLDSEQELEQQKKQEHFSRLRARKVDAFVATMPKQLTIDIGKLGNHDLGSMEFPLQDESINRVAAILKNPSLFSQKFTDPTTGEVDYPKLSRILIQAELSDQIIKSTANKYYSAGIEKVEARQLNNPDLSQVGGGTAASDQARMKQEVEDFNSKQVGQFVGVGAR